MIDLKQNEVTERTRPGNDPGAAPSRSRAAARVLLVLGLGLVAAPLVFSMFSRAPQGATMLTDFEPFMTQQRLAGFSTDIETINASVVELDGTDAARVSPSYGEFSRQWPQIHDDMSGLMDDVTDNLGNYQAVAALPSFRLFPWFFVLPGLLVAGTAAWVLVQGGWTRGARLTLGVVGIGLIAAPVAFGMFSRAPKGGEMMAAFRELETTANVTKIQGYFSEMALGQGAIRTEVVPAFVDRGASAAQVVEEYPATARLNADWVHILNDMTPMIGAMSDNVGHYQAIAALPPFALFPWFFLVPGVLILGATLYAGRPGRRLTEGAA